VFSSGRISATSTGVSVDPGPAVKRNVGCGATESLSFHKLPGGPEFAIGGVNATGRFSAACQGTFEHPYMPADKPNGHSFKGQVQTFVSFVPIPTYKLGNAKAALRELVGEDIPRASKERSWRDCLKRPGS
jgi:hypothetical protein